MARNDFQVAAMRAEAAHSPAEWLSLGQRGRSAAIYKELRGIDQEAAKRLAAKIATARRSVREGEVRRARAARNAQQTQDSPSADHDEITILEVCVKQSIPRSWREVRSARPSPDWISLV